MHNAIREEIGKKIDKVSINHNTLSSALITSDFNAAVLEAKDGYSEDLLSQLKKFANREGLGQSGQANRKNVEERVNLLIKVRDRLAAEDPSNSSKLIKRLNSLEAEWKALTNLLNNYKRGSHNRLDLSKRRHANFVNELNEIISSFLSGSATLHGEYAEAVIVATNYLANAKALQGAGDILSGLSDALRKGVKGHDSSAKGLLSANFDSDFVDLKQVVANTVYDSKKTVDSEGNIFSTRITPDKVDIEITIGNMKVPASVKNYNMGNPTTDIHLLSGRSVLALVQEYGDFVNHYLNVAAEHEDREPSKDLLDSASEAMKLTIFLKALAGGVAGRTKAGAIGSSQEADLFIINDNSTGRFRVYLIDEILDAVQRRVNLLKTGTLDSVNKLSNEYVGSLNDLNMRDAKVRISNLLAQLHQMELQVSIKKEVFV